MPSGEIMDDFHAGKLHSGRSGKIVRKKKQAKAILLSYLRKEGKIPERDEKRKKKHSKKKHHNKRTVTKR